MKHTCIALGTRSWRIKPQPNPYAQLRLFCFPYAGGGASVYYKWPRELPPAIDLYAIQIPGRENRMFEPALTRLTPLIQSLAQALLPYLNRPFAFFGHSMGALVCFELARYLRRQHGMSPAQLFVSGYRAPHLPPSRAPISQLPDAQFIQELRRYNGTPEQILQNAEMMELVTPILRADFSVCESYTYSSEEPFGCPISAFGGLQDNTVSHDDLAAWHYHTRSFFILRMLPGGHFFVQSHRELLLQVLVEDLARLLKPRSDQQDDSTQPAVAYVPGQSEIAA
jgi:medium-chain acyl-[acyl-carrier-protein] hydrolase